MSANKGSSVNRRPAGQANYLEEFRRDRCRGLAVLAVVFELESLI